MKTLDLGMNWKGGLPAVYARNVMDHGDYATVAFVVGSTKGEIVENGQYMIDLISDFNKPEYLEQVKAYLKSINASISFTNDQPHGSFVDPQEVLNKANELYKLPELPQEFNYQVMSGGLYPFRQVYSAVCALMQE